MKVTLNWLRQYVDFDWSAEALAERLTMLGLEVEGVVKLAGEFEGVVVAQVLSRERHPNADKLSLCRVADGRGERQIVCGASNFQAGDKVPLVLPGATLPAQAGQPPLTIKVGKIRGVESHGMLCSPKELGLAEDASGLLILPTEAKVGQPLAEHLGRTGSDVVYDLEITPNRPDLNSAIGIAREISALTGHPLRLPEVMPLAPAPETGLQARELVRVQLEDPELCPRYTARVILGVTIGPSPPWLRHRLTTLGLRTINNVVDVTNYVMLETGQPLHAFDYRRLSTPPGPAGASASPTVVIRRANDGERLVTLDGQERKLTSRMLLIADAQRGLALAGIMGGQSSEIHDQTADLLLESAYFDPRNIRATSKQLDLRSDASYRFERGADIGICDWASRRAAHLILATAGGRLAAGVVDACPQPPAPRRISLRHAKVDELLGIRIPPAAQTAHLCRLGLEALPGADAGTGGPTPELSVTAFGIPTFRVDLKREIDLIEEVARLHGVDQIPSSPPRGALGANAFDDLYDDLSEARRLLTSLGLDETQGQTLISATAAQRAATQWVALANPLSADMNVLRPSLLPGLLDVLRHNANRKNEDVACFELGRVFLPRPAGQTAEPRRLAVALTGRRRPAFWAGDDREAQIDLYDLKGLLEEFLDRFGVGGITYARRPEPTPLFLESGMVQLGKLVLGELGQLLPPLARRYDLHHPVFLAELDLDQLLGRRQASRSFEALPPFPSVRRDVALVVPEATPHEEVLRTMRQARPPHLERVELFDVFRGKNVPAGQKSLAYALTYRHRERTLTDAEVNEAQDRVITSLKQSLGAVVREA